MVLMTLGINYQTAPLFIREKMAFADLESKQTISKLWKEGIVSEAILLSTCNRTELYCDAKNSNTLLDVWLERKQLSVEDLEPYLYTYENDVAVRHLLRVASGLDSMVLGEVEILGQIKTAYRLALEAGTLGKRLDRLFQFTFAVAKQVRSETGIGINPISVASLAVKLADRIFSNMKEATVLLVGAGDLIRLALMHINNLKVKKILLANRSGQQSYALANEYLTDNTSIEVLSLENIPDHLAAADIVMTGTSSVLPILGKGMVERALKTRKHRPIYMVDLGVPRDIEPEVGDLQDIYLYNIDDLQCIAAENLSLRKSAAIVAENIIAEETEQFMGWLRSQNAFQTVKTLKQKYKSVSDHIMDRSLQQLKLGKSPEIILQHALDSLTNRLLHEPIQRLRQAGFSEETELLYYTQQLFGLKNETVDTN